MYSSSTQYTNVTCGPNINETPQKPAHYYLLQVDRRKFPVMHGFYDRLLFVECQSYLQVLVSVQFDFKIQINSEVKNVESYSFGAIL